MERYLPTHRMRDLLADNSLLLPALSRFGISLGFGDSTVGDVCSTHSVDCHTFLAVANFISGKPFDPTAISPRTLMGYLKNAHTYFLDYVLPNIRRRLLEAISSGTQTDVTLVILKFYDEYVGEVRRHMEYENTHVFTYVESLLEGRQTPSGFSIARFKDNHHPIAAKLKEIKEILICHFTADSARVDMLNSLLFDIVICERDLIAHCRVEDSLFIPAIEALENQAASAPAPATGDTAPAASTGLDANGDILLTPRERDIIAAIARGLSNKEIADSLFLSVHTVATHRRNICAKLNIHSASGMTIFAILHGLISMEEGQKLIHN
ncbi:MAG: helix-turn-helix transcriptional regulator [Muribaculaceae bacterium]|nr:helix-turn-helix transcriptional regulator [Muribaculaceae bacterium]